MGKRKATPQQVATTRRGMTDEERNKVLRTRLQLARLLLQPKDVPDILLPDLEKLMMAGNTVLLHRTERAEEYKAEVGDLTGEIEEAEAEAEEPEEPEPPAPPRGRGRR